MKPDSTKLAGTLLFVGTFQFIIMMIISEALYPSYNIYKNYISDLGVGATAYIFNSSIILFGALVLVSSYFIFLNYRWRIFLISIALSGIGALGVGLFPEGSPYLMHTIMSLITFLFGGISAVLSYRIVPIPFKYISAACGIMALISLILYADNFYISLGPGGMERMIVYPILLWVIGFSGYLMSYKK